MIDSLTQSSVNQFFKCGVQFEFRWVRGLIIPPGIAARKGSSVHRSAEHDYRAVIDSGKPAPEDEVADMTRDEFVRLCKDEGVFLSAEDKADKDVLLGAALDEAVNAAKFHHRRIVPQKKKIALIEERLHADVGLPLPISGKPDLVADGVLDDLKTASKRWPSGREDQEIQPTVYRMLLRKNGYGDLPAQYTILTNMKKAPKDDALLWDDETMVCADIRQAPRDEQDEAVLLRRMEMMTQMLERGDFLPATTGAWWCSEKWCGYASICPYIKLGAMSLSERIPLIHAMEE